jgi:hypothetical protein
MSSVGKGASPSRSGLAARVEALRRGLAQVPPDLLAGRTGCSYQSLGPGRGEFHLAVFDAPVLVSYPGLVGFDRQDDALPLPTQAVLAYYFQTGDGAPLTGEWVSFAELPDGRTYNQAFQGYSGDELARVFGLDVEAFKAACQASGGTAAPLGDAAYVFHALPRVPLLANYWCGDEEFPSSCRILFDRAASHYLPTDVCAILGGLLAGRLVKGVKR